MLEGDGTGGKFILEGYELAVHQSEDSIDDPTNSNDGPFLSEKQRDKIAQLVAGYLLTLSDIPDHNVCPIVAKKIVELFPSECAVSITIVLYC